MVLFQIEISKTYSRAEWGEDIKKVESEGGSAGGVSSNNFLAPRAAPGCYFTVPAVHTYSAHPLYTQVLRMAGEANKPVVFLFADTQIKDESFVEDISNLLNTYEVRVVQGWEGERAPPPFMADISNLLYTSPPRCPT